MCDSIPIYDSNDAIGLGIVSVLLEIVLRDESVWLEIFGVYSGSSNR